MRADQIKQLLHILPVTQSILLLGPPGVGKSEVVKSFAAEEAAKLGMKFVEYDEKSEVHEDDYVFVDFRLTEVEPADLLGLPRVGNEYSEYVPLKWAYTLSKAKRGLLFLDELTNLQRADVLSAAFKLILDRRAGFTRIAEGVRVIAAGNKPEHSAVASELPTPLINRFCVLEVGAPTLEAWLDYMNQVGKPWDARVGAYLASLGGQDLIRLPKEATTSMGYPTPRSWSRIAWVLGSKEEWSPDLLETIAIGFLGPEVGTRFAAFCRQRVPTYEELVKDPQQFLKLPVEGQWLAIAVIVSHCKEKGVDDSLAAFIKMLLENKREFLMVLKRSLPVPVFDKILRLIRKAGLADKTVTLFADVISM